MHIPNSNKLVEFFNIDVVITVGFKTNSKRAIIFKKWASKILIVWKREISNWKTY